MEQRNKIIKRLLELQKLELQTRNLVSKNEIQRTKKALIKTLRESKHEKLVKIVP